MANKWFIAIKERGENVFDLSGLTIIESEPNTYWADPFLAEHEGKTFCFFEAYDYNKGVLAVAEVNGLQFENAHIFLNEQEHMSFPSVVMGHDGNWYMAPERVIAGELLVYKCLEFPDVWTVHSRVAMGRYDDPILHPVPGGWYEIWTTDDNKLRVFQSDKEMHEWRVIKTEDKPYMRSAGHFIDGLRPTQDSVPIYGRAMKFLDHEGKMKHYIEPDWYPELTGTHTFNATDKYVVIDGRIRL